MSARMHIPADPADRSRPGISTDRITAAALRIVDAEGSQALTMHRLGQALDRKVMTLYRYVPGKDALLDGVVALVLTGLAINPAAADWRQELRDLATSFRSLALAHPNAVPLLAPELASYDGAAHLQQGVEMMITGLQSHFQPARTSPTT